MIPGSKSGESLVLELSSLGRIKPRNPIALSPEREPRPEASASLCGLPHPIAGVEGNRGVRACRCPIGIFVLYETGRSFQEGAPPMNVRVAPRLTRAAEGLPRRRFTVAEVEAMVLAGVLDEDERVELIGGELAPMSPKGSRHEVVKVALNDHWSRRRPESCRLAQETTFRLSLDTYLEPDFVIYERATGLTGFEGDNVLLVVEVADSSRRYDLGRKAKLYAGFGVRELWVIDAVKMSVRVFRSPTPKGYGETRDFSASDELTPAFAPNEFALRLDALELD